MPLLRTPRLRLPPARDGLWSRRLLSLAVAAVVTVAVAAPLLALSRSTTFDGFACVVWLMFGVHHLGRRWWPRRNGRLAWTARVAGRDAVEPGLVARRSLAGWTDLLADLSLVAWTAVVVTSYFPADREWGRIVRTLLVLGAAVAAGRAAYREARFTGRLALTAGGIRYGSQSYDWSNIDRVSLHKRDGRLNGVRLRPVRWPSLEPAPVVGGRDTAVPEQRLAAAIEEYRSRPYVLAGGPVTAPEPAVEPAGR
ncbi:hypothetical protein ACFT9M_03010 [Micromonospora purpureochromogenes]|uniref:hypothetical protein n=1 Tax=Micromonospora purpureochromogenes TaxID=47872 RepID=UPI0036433889